MNIDSRGHLYRSFRKDGKVCREYIGCGELAQFRAECDAHGRREREEDKRRWRAELVSLDEQDRRSKMFYDAVSATMRVVLEANGYHLHARSQWRKKRGTMNTKSIETSKPGLKSIIAMKDEIVRLLVRAIDGDIDALKEVFATVQSTELESGIVDIFADVAAHSTDKLTKTFGDTPLHREAFSRKVAAMKDDLSGPLPSPLERLLVERIINCWLQVHQLEIHLNSQENTCSAEYFDKRLDKAHKRYLASIKSLAQVRKLQLPSVQINVAEQQVNVAAMRVEK